MRVFHCDHCHFPIYFENTVCGQCGHKLAYLPDLKIIGSLDPADPGAHPLDSLWTCPLPRAAGRAYRLCLNYAKYDACNWAVPADDANEFCPSCRLTRIIPDLSVPANEVAWKLMETAKRRLVYSIMEFGLPLKNRLDDPATGLVFEFLSDPIDGPRVLTGHDNGVITLNVIEADDVERERLRVSLHEPYRTLLGHFRHEVGHYYWDRLIRGGPRLDAFRAMFGDEQFSYNAALQAYYAQGPAPDWRERFISAYASMHPWEDWAETWAHYFHMTDTLETAAACGLSLQPDRPNEPAMARQPRQRANDQSFDEIITNWFPLTYILNALNRGMGLADAYPFVLPMPAIEKLRFVHETICAAERAGRAQPMAVAVG
jgi:hypothetical protein